MKKHVFSTVIVSLLAIVSIGYQLYDFQGLNINLNDVPDATADIIKSSAQDYSLDNVARLHLFGRQAVEKKVTVEQEVPAKPTRLALTLLGVSASLDKHLQAAIITSPGNKAKHYRLGDEVRAGVTLYEIMENRVILKNGIDFETLRLAQDRVSIADGIRIHPKAIELPKKVVKRTRKKIDTLPVSERLLKHRKELLERHRE